MRSLHSLFILFLATALVGCSNTQFAATSTTPATADAAVVTTTTTTTTTVTPTPTPTVAVATCNSASSPTADLNIVSVAQLSDYAAKGLYAPSNIKIAVSTQNIAGTIYPGTVQISYTDLGAFHAGTFTASAGVNPIIDTLDDNGIWTAAYNTWFGGGNYFSGYFQDGYGAVVLTVRSTDANGCSSGEVYYKNFAATYAAQSPYRACWFIKAGPYDCRSLNTMFKSAIEPSNGYALLGTFSGLPKAAAFK
jgi:hypothetical protein